MSVVQLEDKIVELVNDDKVRKEFIFNLLDIYDLPKATITRLKNGNQNLSKEQGEVHLKNKLWYKRVEEGEVFEGYLELENKVNELSSKPRYLIVTDFINLLAKDMKTLETLDIEFKSLPQYFEFFLAWKGIEKIDYEKENPADIKAAERFARLYDAILKENEGITNNEGFNEFLIRLLFCLFAEDTDVFPKGVFTNAIKTLTLEDGSDLNKFFEELFLTLNAETRGYTANYLKQFPYVGGTLFEKPHIKLNFTKKTRKLIIECGELLNWSKINPDILGSMIQAVASDENRSHFGMHYTSVSNILKVIKPLFLDELYDDFEKAYNSMEKLNELYDKIGKISFFDPACGSGNFLIITYKELRKLEIKILLRQRELSTYIMYIPSVTLDQFYGIEINNFAHDVAKLSLWIAEHQMNMELEEVFNDKVRAILPLKSTGKIICGNALREDWNTICSSENSQVFIFGNPPYYGSRNQTNAQKEDMEFLLSDLTGYKKLDYIAGWFYLAAKYTSNNNASFAFVSTNSLFQGEQVPILWDRMYQFNIGIEFTYSPFKWINNAKDNAGVTVVIVGFRKKENLQKQRIYFEDKVNFVSNINAYLTNGPDIIVIPRNRPIHGLPKLNKGNAAYDDGHFTFNQEEFAGILEENPEVAQFMKKYMSAEDFINGTYKYCLWLTPDNLEYALRIPFIVERVSKVKKYRLSSKRAVTRKQAENPYAFGEIRYQEKLAFVIPVHSSESRKYIPMGFIQKEIIPSYATFVMYDAPLWLVGVLQSSMHMVWIRAVAGTLESRIRYSSNLCYNTFPFPNLNSSLKKELEDIVLEILDIREEYSGTLADLYDPNKMPENLVEAHKKLDLIVEKSYQNKVFDNDIERLELLFKYYHKMTKE